MLGPCTGPAPLARAVLPELAPGRPVPPPERPTNPAPGLRTPPFCSPGVGPGGTTPPVPGCRDGWVEPSGPAPAGRAGRSGTIAGMRWSGAWRRRLRRAARRAPSALGVAGVALVGGGLGWALAPPAATYVGPLEVQVSLTPGLDPGTVVDLPPVGTVSFDSHDAPLVVRGRITSVDVDAAAALLDSPQGLLGLQVTAPRVLEDAVVRAAASVALTTTLGAAAGVLLVYRRPRPTAAAGAGTLVVLLVLAAGVVRTADPTALQQPRFDGLLSRAPYLAGAGRDVAQRLESYRSGLSDLVRSVTALYAVAGDLPALPDSQQTTTVLHVSDLHLNPLGIDVVADLVEQFGVDAVVDTGDVTTWGSAPESGTLAPIGALGVPYVFVRGNHDSAGTATALAALPNAVVLEDEVAEVAGLVVAGIGDPRFTPGEGETDDEDQRAVVGAAAGSLADTVSAHDRADPADPADPVDVALIHDPSNLDALFGTVPLVLAGHYHHRVVRTDPDSGTRVMVEGTTGGAGLTAAGLTRLEQGAPLAMSATLLRFASGGPRDGELIAFDQVTVGGLGLTSVTIERTVVPPSADVAGAGSG